MFSLSTVLQGVNLRTNSFQDGEDDTSLKCIRIARTSQRNKLRNLQVLEDPFGDITKPYSNEEKEGFLQHIGAYSLRAFLSFIDLFLHSKGAPFIKGILVIGCNKYK